MLGNGSEGLWSSSKKRGAYCSEQEASGKQRTVGTQGAGARSRERVSGDPEL